MDKIYDVVIIGGGPAGLSAALVLGRSLRQVVLIDEGKPRNSVTLKSHGFLTRDGVEPAEFRRLAHEDLQRYESIKIVDCSAEDVSKLEKLFKTTCRNGEIFLSRKIIFATGSRDHLPEIRGIEDVYGKTVFHCPYCDGWERQGEKLAVVGNTDGFIHYIKNIYNWSKDLIVFSNGRSNLSEEEKNELKERNIPIVEEEITELKSEDGRLSEVVMENGDTYSCSGAFLADTGEIQASVLPIRLGVPLKEDGGCETEGHGKTKLDGVYVIGDAKNIFTGVAGAAGEGYGAGVAVNTELVEEDWEK